MYIRRQLACRSHKADNGKPTFRNISRNTAWHSELQLTIAWPFSRRSPLGQPWPNTLCALLIYHRGL